jgi:CPA2 family monovalent cation:H+ antiporter-2
MDPAADHATYKDAMIFLATAALVVPLVHRRNVSPILGFFVAGAVLGPKGLGALSDEVPVLEWITITSPAGLGSVAELGVVFLMFLIGLELPLPRLLTMRRLVFGLGGLQGLVTTVVISFGALWVGQPAAAALIIGACLALSSTAIVMELLSGQRRMMSTTGRTSFAILLAQDLAVVPLLFLIGALGSAADGATLLQGIAVALAEAGFEIVASSYAPIGAYAAYTCVRS